MTTETRTVQVSRQNVESAIAAFFYATTTLHDNEEVLHIKFSEINSEMFTLEIKLRKELN